MNIDKFQLVFRAYSTVYNKATQARVGSQPLQRGGGGRGGGAKIRRKLPDGV
jgi:hypothetical protein